MKIAIKEFTNRFTTLLAKFQRFQMLLFIVLVASVYGFLVLKISQLSNAEPSATAITENLKGVKRPKIDQSAIDKIEQLQSTNIEVKSLFNQARDNPFQE